MTGIEVVTLVGVLVAAFGYFVKYATDLRLAQRNDRLDRINRQLSGFYSPLLAFTRSSEESWRAFRRRYRPPGSKSFWRAEPAPTREDVLMWRLWVTTMFMPANERITQLVIEHADLVEEPEMPPCLLALRAHVAGYQAIKEWDLGEVSLAREDNISVVNFPGHELADYATPRFGRLKTEQSALLGTRTPTPRSVRQP